MDQTEENTKKLSGTGRFGFFRQASHDIQGTFFGVSSLCVMIKDAKDNQESLDVLVDHLIEACHTYKYKLNNFLEYARFDAGLKDTLLEPVYLRLLLTRIIQENKHAASEKGVEIKFLVAEDIPELIISDEFRIAQICTNILTNAINFSPAGSPVLLRVDKKGDNNWVMIIEDHGPGMKKEELNSVFQSSAGERTALKNPAGLGLLITKYLAEDLLKGKISLSSESNMGTRVTVVFPLHEQTITMKLPGQMD